MNKIYPSQGCMQFYLEIVIKSCGGKKSFLKEKQFWVVLENSEGS